MKQTGSVSLIFLLPLFLAVTLIIVSSTLVISFYGLVKHTCLTSAMSSQEVMLTNLEELLRLNPLAKSLRLKLLLAKARIASSAHNPALLAAAYANYRLVISQQIRLQRHQEGLLNNARNLGYKPIEKFRTTLDSEFTKRNFDNSAITTVVPRKVGLAVRKSPINSLTPNHEPVPLFSVRQGIDLKSKWRVSSLLPKGFQGFLPKLQDLNIACGATIEKERNRWIVKITKGS